MFNWIKEEIPLLKEAKQSPQTYVLWGGLSLWVWLAGYSTMPQLGLIILAGLLAILTVIDTKHYILPDILTYSGTILGLFLAPKLLGLPWGLSVAGAVVGASLFSLLAICFYIVKRKHGLGFGDVKLLALLGAWGGIMCLLPTLLIASISALLFLPLRRMLTGAAIGQPIPFGPFLAFGGWISILYGGYFWNLLANLHHAIGSIS